MQTAPTRLCLTPFPSHKRCLDWWSPHGSRNEFPKSPISQTKSPISESLVPELRGQPLHPLTQHGRPASSLPSSKGLLCLCGLFLEPIAPGNYFSYRCGLPSKCSLTVWVWILNSFPATTQVPRWLEPRFGLSPLVRHLVPGCCPHLHLHRNHSCEPESELGHLSWLPQRAHDEFGHLCPHLQHLNLNFA